MARLILKAEVGDGSLYVTTIINDVTEFLEAQGYLVMSCDQENGCISFNPHRGAFPHKPKEKGE